MKSYYNLCFVICLVQLLGWLCMPFVGIDAIILKVSSRGFYGNMYSDNPHQEAADIWGVSVGVAEAIDRTIAIIYFLVLVVVVGSIFVRKRFDLDKLTRIVFYLTLTSLIIILGVPIKLF